MHEHIDDTFGNADGTYSSKPQKIVISDESLADSHHGGICVHAGTFTISQRGVHHGSLRVEPGAEAVIEGTHNGSLHVAAESTVSVSGRHNGSTHVEHGGAVRVEPGGALAGSLHVSGRIENAGTRGGSEHLVGGEIVDLPGGQVVQPTRKSDGVSVYNF